MDIKIKRKLMFSKGTGTSWIFVEKSYMSRGAIGLSWIYIYDEKKASGSSGTKCSFKKFKFL